MVVWPHWFIGGMFFGYALMGLKEKHGWRCLWWLLWAGANVFLAVKKGGG